jgi:transposase InsO family protein
VVEIASDRPELLPRELAHHITDKHKWFISESSVYRILKARGLVTSPAHIVMSASDSFKDKTTRVHQMCQTDFTYMKVMGWGWYYLSTILDDFSRYIIHWKLCDSMKDQDVERSVAAALIKTGLKAGERPKLLSDNGPCYRS